MFFIIIILVNWNVYQSFVKSLVYCRTTQSKLYKVCSEQSILGGYATFGVGTAVQQLFYLPPHYQIRIKINFWKQIEGCQDNELFLVVRKVPVNVDTVTKIYNFQIEIIASHKQETLVILLKASLDDWRDENVKFNKESWGFNNFYLDILKCSPDCLLCNHPYVLVKHLQLEDIRCQGDQIYQQVKLNSLLRFQVKIWLIDIQGLANSFNIGIDGIPYAFNINSVCSISLCAFSPQKSIQNNDWNFTHQNPEIELQFIPSSLIGSNSFWALFNFNLFIFKCHSYYIKCLERLKTDFQICAEEWIKEDGECNRIQNPLKITKAQTKYILNQSISILFLFKLQQIEFPNNSGFFKRDENKIELEVNVQCIDNGYIKSVMHFCHSCQGYNIYSSTFQCKASQQTIINIDIQFQNNNNNNNINLNVVDNSNSIGHNRFYLQWKHLLVRGLFRVESVALAVFKGVVIINDAPFLITQQLKTYVIWFQNIPFHCTEGQLREK